VIDNRCLGSQDAARAMFARMSSPDVVKFDNNQCAIVATTEKSQSIMALRKRHLPVLLTGAIDPAIDPIP
jgi:hypothetical protein